MIIENICKQHLIRIDELLAIVGIDTSTDNINFIELETISDLVADYEGEVRASRNSKLD